MEKQQKNQKIYSKYNQQKVSLVNYNLNNLQMLKLYTNLIELDIRNNKINEICQIYKLPNKKLLKSIKVSGNPLCQCINYMYQLIIYFPNLQIIDSVNIDFKLKNQLIYAQNNLGNIIVQFLFFKSWFFKGLILNQNQQQIIIQMENLLKLNLNQLIKDQRQFFPYKNNILIQCLRNLISKILPAIDSVTYNQIQQFLLRQIICYSTKNQLRKGFLNRLLERVSLINDQHEQKIIQDPEYSIKTLQRQLIYEYEISLQQNECSNPYKSVQTQDTYSSNSFRFLHFCLDQNYIEIVYGIVKDNIQNFLQKITSFKQFREAKIQFKIVSNRIQEISEDSLQLSRSLKEDFTQRFYRIQNNMKPTKRQTYYINDDKFKYDEFQNRVKNFILKLSFKKILKTKNIIKADLLNLFNVLTPIISQQLRYGWKSLILFSSWYGNIQQQLKIKKLLRIIKKWKQIKNRKKYLLKKYLNKKINLQKITLHFLLKQWKIITTQIKLGNYIKQIKQQKVLKQIKSQKKLEINYKKVLKKYGFK